MKFSIIVAALVMTSLLITSMSPQLNASLNSGSSAFQFIKANFPELLEVLPPHYRIIGPVRDPVTDLQTVKVVWNSSGIYVEVNEVLLNSRWVVKALYVTLDSTVSSRTASFINKYSDNLQTDLNTLYMKVASSVKPPYSLIGFGIYWHSTPIGYLLPGPYLSPARVYWGLRYEGPITALIFLDDLPVVKYLVNSSNPHFRLDDEGACKALNNSVKTEVSCKGVEAPSKYYLIVNGSLRPAYIKYLTPYEVAVIMGDDGRVILPSSYAAGKEETRKEVGISEVFYWVSAVAFALAAITALLWWVKLRKL